MLLAYLLPGLGIRHYLTLLVTLSLPRLEAECT